MTDRLDLKKSSPGVEELITAYAKSLGGLLSSCAKSSLNKYRNYKDDGYFYGCLNPQINFIMTCLPIEWRLLIF